MLTLWNVSKIYKFQFLNKTDEREGENQNQEWEKDIATNLTNTITLILWTTL